MVEQLAEFPASRLTAAVAIRADALIDRRQFHHDIMVLRARLDENPATRWGLYCEDSYIFAVSLLALLLGNKIPLVLPGIQPGFIDGIASELDGIITDRPDVANGLAVMHPQTGDGVSDIPAAFPAINDIDGNISLFTSGSTGEPKRIDKTLRQLKDEITVLEKLWGNSLRNAVIVSTVSHQHIYGLLFKVLWPLLTGRCFDSLQYQYPEALLERISGLPEACLVSSPAHLKRIPHLVDLATVKGRIVSIFSSGGPLPTPAALIIHQTLDIDVLEIFGSTETGGVAYRAQKHTDDKAWTPLPSVEIRADAEDNCLLIRSPFEGSGGFFKMGDIIEPLQDGRFVNLGRADKIVKIEEKRVSLAGIEQRLLELDMVEDAAATVIGEQRDEIGVAVVLSAAGEAVLESRGKHQTGQALKKHLSHFFEAVTLPRKWRFVKQLPVNAQGKITQAAIKELFKAPAVILPLVNNIERTENTIVLELLIPQELLYFEGHFPGDPILPGVAQTGWAYQLGRKYFHIAGEFLRLEVIKFHTFIRPGDTVLLSLTHTAANNKLSFSYDSQTGTHYSSGRIVFGEW